MENLAPYLEFIQECRNKEYQGKTHSHHIIPRFMGGGNEEDNLISLSYEDHQKAHVILGNCFEKGSPEWRGNINSANFLQMQVKNPEWYKKENHPFYGVPLPDETKEKIRDSLIKFNKENPNYMKEALKKRDLSGEKNPMYGNGHRVAGEKNGRYGGKGTTDETRRKISEANAGRTFSEETRKLLSEQSSGEGNGMYGRSAYDIWVEKYGKEEADKRKEEAKKKISAAGKGKPKSAEHKEKLRQAALNRKKK